MDEHERRTVNELCRLHGEEIAVIRNIVESIKTSLYGNGQPGILDKYDKRISYLEKRFWIGLGIFLLFQFLSGSGVISLHNLIGGGK